MNIQVLGLAFECDCKIWFRQDARENKVSLKVGKLRTIGNLKTMYTTITELMPFKKSDQIWF